MKDIRDEIDWDLTRQIGRSPISSTKVHSHSKGEEQHLPCLCSYFSFKTIFYPLFCHPFSPLSHIMLATLLSKVIILLTIVSWLTGEPKFDVHPHQVYDARARSSISLR